MQFVPAENTLYRITSGLDKDMVLDISGNPQDQKKAILYEWNNGANQKFAFRSVGGGKYAIFCSANNLTVEVPGSSQDNGAHIHCSQPNKQSNEFWEFVPCTDKKFQGKNAHYLRSFCGKALDVCEGKAKKEQAIIQWDYNGDKNQVWIIEPIF